MHHLARHELLGIACFFTVVMIRPALEHCISKALPACYDEHPSLVPKKCACVMEMYLWLYMNQVYTHSHFCKAMHVCMCVHKQGRSSRALLQGDA